MENFILSYVLWWQPLGYLIVFGGMLFEGDTFVFISAFLTQQGLLKFKYIIPAISLGVLAGDLIWYWLGAKYKDSQSRAVQWVLSIGKPFDNHLKEKPLRTIFISKFTYGFHHPVLLRAGALGLPLKQFIKDDVISSFLWLASVGILGYFSGFSFNVVKHYLKFGEAALLLGLIIFFVIDAIIARASKNKL